MASKEIVAGGFFHADADIWHGFVTKNDRTSTTGGHLEDLVLAHIAHPPHQELTEWHNEGRKCCILDWRVTATGVSVLVPCPNGNTKKIIGAHVYDSNDPDASAEQCLIIPTCEAHNNRWGNRTRGQNWNGNLAVPNEFNKIIGIPQVVKAGTPFVVRQIRANHRPAQPNDLGGKGKGKGKGNRVVAAGLPYNTQDYEPTENVTMLWPI